MDHGVDPVAHYLADQFLVLVRYSANEALDTHLLETESLITISD